MIQTRTDIETLLDKIRQNCVIMSDYHKKRYLYLKERLKLFKIPIIILSSLNSVFSVGSQPYLEQGHISALVSGISLIVGILGSIELFMKVSENMEVELLAQREFYILSISIYKILQLDKENRNVDMKLFLEETFSQYQKLIENSNVVEKKIKDKLTLLDGVSKVETLATSSSLSTSLSIDQLFNEHTESEQNAV
jgi:hypothetical protein